MKKYSAYEVVLKEVLQGLTHKTAASVRTLLPIAGMLGLAGAFKYGGKALKESVKGGPGGMLFKNKQKQLDAAEALGRSTTTIGKDTAVSEAKKLEEERGKEKQKQDNT